VSENHDPDFLCAVLLGARGIGAP